MLSKVEHLWEGRQLPLDALCFRNGACYDVELDTSRPGGLAALEPFDPEEELGGEDDGDLADAWGHKAAVELPDGQRLTAGECVGHGAEGYFARVAEDGSLVWGVALGDSDPFVDITLSGRRAVFRSSGGVEVEVEVDDPRQPLGG